MTRETVIEHFSKYTIDGWKQKNNEFDPLDIIVNISGGSGYDWDDVLIFKNANHTYALIEGSGCSCNSIDDEMPEVFPTKNQVIVHLNKLAEASKWRDTLKLAVKELKVGK